MTHFRDYSVYVQGKTQRRLRWIVAALGNTITADEYADTLLNEVIEQRYPSIIEAEKQFASAEQCFVESVRK